VTKIGSEVFSGISAKIGISKKVHQKSLMEFRLGGG